MQAREIILPGPVSAIAAEGEGPPLVLLHGIGSSGRGFAPALPFLPRRRILAPDMPGYGGSAPLAAEFPAPDDFADWLAAVLDSAGIGRADLLGHSLGGVMVAAFARRHPHRLGRIVLSAPARGYAVADRQEWPPGAWKRLRDFEAMGAEAYAAARAPRLVHRQEAAEAVRAEMARLTRAGLAASTALLARGDTIGWLAAHPPVAVITGDEDAIVPPDASRALAAHLGSRFVLLPGAGHAPYAEDPEAWGRAVSAALP
ncbi:MAG: alpha/beta fold hydrolase [Acetobacteraceae bacterium]|nr:alpha/beta fold hydrolase [Acetobacteraceae bacterium]MCX7685591.1 alpha/beta fold hydrolase [Acetobacteraceae bacterium]MDW8397350.1 alpha/beta fold hydrolase [Acetobacteraceae bacterium]